MAYSISGERLSFWTFFLLSSLRILLVVWFASDSATTITHQDVHAHYESTTRTQAGRLYRHSLTFPDDILVIVPTSATGPRAAAVACQNAGVI
eukprot:scaffold5219_cov45-Prasinocladus_malaysianus.AAC.3